jgi:hypothetical protein
MFLNAIFQIILRKNNFSIYYLDWSKNPAFIKKQKTNLSEQDGLLEKHQSSIAQEPIGETFSSWFAAANRNFTTT